MFSFMLDEAAGVLRVATEGSWTVDEARRFRAGLLDRTEAMRRRFDCARILIDASRSPAQSPEVLAQLDMNDELIVDPRDRMAVIVASSLVKMQSKQMLPSSQADAFLSPSAAETWLRAYD
jgi:hypothetical protein